MKYLLCSILLLNIASGFISPALRPNTVLNSRFAKIRLQCIQVNKQSYYNTHAIVSNISKDITDIYTTYDNRYTLVFYKNGSHSEYLNKTLRLKYSHDALNLHIVSNIYFKKIYTILKDLRNSKKI